MAHVPADAASIDARWLTHALRSAELLADGVVHAVRVEPLDGSQGFAGQLRRLCVDYAAVSNSVPTTFVVKLHSPNRMTRDLIWQLGAAEREIRFYREISLRTGVPTATLYYAATDGPRYVLLLEDLAPASAGDVVAGSPPEQLLMALSCVARMHARWWNSKELSSIGWIPAFEELTASRHAISREAWPEFVDRYEGRLPPEFKKVGQVIMNGLDHVRESLSQVPMTLLHGDFRPDNVMFTETGTKEPVALLDWQVMFRGPAVADIAYYLVSASSRESRREIEMSILRRYQATLTAAGVAGYEVGPCVRDYRVAMADVLSRIVVLTSRVRPESEAGWRAFDALVERIAGAVIDLECEDLAKA
jgi:hypothetical protein